MVTLTIDWAKSPRIVLVEDPDTEVTQQELIDLLRDAEFDFNNLDDKYIIKGDGKQTLDAAGTLVGITNTLQNAQLGFEAETAAESTGMATSNDVTGKTLTDTSATFETDGVTRGAVIINFDDFSVASVLEVVNQNTIIHTPLADGSTNQWAIGDAYKIWNIKQGIISGGNLVAVDENGDALSTPVYPTPFTQIILSSSSSATLQNLEEIKRIAGMVGEYKRIHTITRDGDDNVTAAIMDIYDNEADYDAQTNRLARYNVSATFIGQLMATFGMKLE